MVSKEARGPRNPGATTMSHQPPHDFCTYRQRSAGTRAACRVRTGLKGGDWLPLWGLVALRLACKIRQLLAEGSRVAAFP